MWFWVLLWVGLVLAGAAVLGLLGWQVLGKARALIAEATAASERLTVVLDPLNDALDPSRRPNGPHPVSSPTSPESPRRSYPRPSPH